MGSALEELFAHNTWANLRLIEACETLSDEQLEFSVPGTYGGIRDTILHIVGAQERYVWRLGGEEPENLAWENEFPGFEKLNEVTRRTGEALTILAADTPADRVLNLSFQGKDYLTDATVVLVQAINHGTEHRAQVLTTLTHQGIEPPTLDGWTYGGAAGKIREGGD